MKLITNKLKLVTAVLALAVFAMAITVNATPATYTVAYAEGEHGMIGGAPSETLMDGGHPQAVPTVTPARDYVFVGWSSDYGVTKLTAEEVMATMVTGNTTYTAYYAKKGDATGDDGVTNVDALLLTKYLKGKITLTGEQELALDMNEDNRLDETDVQAILAVSVGKGTPVMS